MQSITFTRLWTENGRGIWMFQLVSGLWVDTWVKFSRYPLEFGLFQATKPCQPADVLSSSETHRVQSLLPCCDDWPWIICYFPMPVVQMHGMITSDRWWFQSCFLSPYLRKCSNLTSVFKWLETTNHLGRASTFSPWWFLAFDSNSHTFTQTSYRFVTFDYFVIFYSLHILFEEYLFVFVCNYEFMFLVQISHRVPWKIPTARGHRVQHAARCVSWRMFS